MAYLNCPTCRLTVYSPTVSAGLRGVPALPGEAGQGQPPVQLVAAAAPPADECPRAGPVSFPHVESRPGQSGRTRATGRS